MKPQDLQQYIDVVIDFFEPLVIAVESPDQAEALLIELGYSPPSDVLAFEELNDVFDSIYDLIEQFEEILEESEDDVQADVLVLLLELLLNIKQIVSAIDSIQDKIQSNFAGTDFLDQTDILTEIPQKLVDYLFVNFLEKNHGPTYAFLGLIGIIEEDEVDDVPTDFHAPYLKRTINWAKIPDFFSNPIGTLKTNIKDGDEYLYYQLSSLLQELGISLGLLSGFREPDFLVLSAFNDDQDLSDWEDFEELEILRFPLLPSHDADLAIEVYPIVDKATNKYMGLGIGLSFGAEFEIPLNDTFKLVLTLSTGLNNGLGFTIDENDNFKFINDIFTSPEEILANTQFGVKVALVGEGGSVEDEDDKLFVFGTPEGSRFEIGSFALALGIEKTDFVRFYVESDLLDDLLNLTFGGADGFVSNVAGEGIEANFNLGVGISNKGGLYFKGSSSLEISLPTHIQLGPIEIQSLALGLLFKNDSFPLTIGGTFSANLGPLAAVVENIGIRAVFKILGDRSGNLGPLDVQFGFKPPNGVGLSIDAGAVKGGGYLFFDTDREEYAGALELVFSEWIALKAIGLITTKMPDGSKGFSLLIIITVEFGTGFQLGFGFTLLGVGGLLGLNRIVRIDPLKEGVRTGAVESVMFPEDVIANAPRIISDLRRFFPPQQDIFLVGPMAKIGWGTPTLISLQLGVILEFPRVNITILGVIKVVLPDEEADVLRLQVNFVGRIEPSNQLLWFYAELYDSRVLFITLEGGMGLYVNWGDNANFVVSVGGFHPRYNPPPLPFPEPPRIAVNILNESYAKVRIEGYFAVTSNSVQFGARAELFFGVSDFNIEGFLGFDALFQFDPFYFSFGLSVSLSVKVFGIGLFSVGFSGLLEGPTPWHIEGKGSIGLLFFSISVPFEHTWGQSQDTKLEPIEVFPLLEKEFEALTNWEARLPESSNILVSLRKLGETESDRLVLHPVGKLRISQRKVPINFKLDKIGNQRPADVIQVDVDAVLPGSSLSIADIDEKFAIGQFKDLDGSNQLSSPAFEPLEGGIEIGVAGEQIKTSRAVRRVIRYETIIIDNNFKRHAKSFFGFFITGYAVLNAFLFVHFLGGSAVKKSVLSQHHKKRMQPFAEVIQVQPMHYSVAFNTDNRPIDVGATTFTSQAKAMEHMAQQIQTDAGLANRLHVIPNTELNLTA